MDLKEILAIAGKPGLYKMIGQTKNGAVVESLIDGKRFTAFIHERISSLEEISIYTEGEDMALKDVFKRIYEKQDGKEAIDPKAGNKELQEFFEDAVPEYDKERVYISDIKKVLKWYNLLLENELLDFSEEETTEEETTEEETSTEENTEEEKESTDKPDADKSGDENNPGEPEDKK